MWFIIMSQWNTMCDPLPFVEGYVMVKRYTMHTLHFFLPIFYVTTLTTPGITRYTDESVFGVILYSYGSSKIFLSTSPVSLNTAE